MAGEILEADDPFLVPDQGWFWNWVWNAQRWLRPEAYPACPVGAGQRPVAGHGMSWTACLYQGRRPRRIYRAAQQWT